MKDKEVIRSGFRNLRFEKVGDEWYIMYETANVNKTTFIMECDRELSIRKNFEIKYANDDEYYIIEEILIELEKEGKI